MKFKNNKPKEAVLRQTTRSIVNYYQLLEPLSNKSTGYQCS